MGDGDLGRGYTLPLLRPMKPPPPMPCKSIGTSIIFHQELLPGYRPGDDAPATYSAHRQAANGGHGFQRSTQHHVHVQHTWHTDRRRSSRPRPCGQTCLQQRPHPPPWSLAPAPRAPPKPLLFICKLGPLLKLAFLVPDF